MSENYQDFIIKNGKLIGKFEEMYRTCDDPWGRDSMEELCLETSLLRRACLLANSLEGGCRVFDIGCGVGSSMRAIADSSAQMAGIDVSETAIQKARQRLPEHQFAVAGLDDVVEDSPAIQSIDIRQLNLLIMSQVTWYVLKTLPAFKEWLQANWKGKLFIHILGIYPPGVQQYGKEYFTNQEEILAWWGLNYLEYGTLSRIVDGDPKTLSYFIAQI